MISLDAATHTYSDAQGRVYPGVTEIIRAAGLYGNALDFIDPWYMERGTAVHEATALADQELLDWDTLDPRVDPFVLAWLQFRENTGYCSEFIEQSFVHPIYQFAGTLDRNGLDIKCGAPVPAYQIQAAAYSRLSGGECSRWMTVYLQDDCRYKVHTYSVSELFEGWKVFQAALAIYNWRKANNI